MGFVKLMTLFQLLVQMITGLGLTIETIELGRYDTVVYKVIASTKTTRVNQQLSYDQLNGFQSLSELAKYKPSSELGINGMFYNHMGRPYGSIMMNGEFVSATQVGSPILTIDKEGMVQLLDSKFEVNIKVNGKRIPVSYNRDSGKIRLYTAWYGETDKTFHRHFNIRVEKNRCLDIVNSRSEVDLVSDNAIRKGLPTSFNLVIDQAEAVDIKKGDKITVEIETDFDYQRTKEAFQTGGWLVRKGKNVAKKKEAYIGPTNSLQPRTAIGIVDQQTILVILADGRNYPDSSGLTGYQLAEILLQNGCTAAGYLDGGASTTLVQAGQVINKPSLKKEKKIAHGIFFERVFRLE